MTWVVLSRFVTVSKLSFCISIVWSSEASLLSLLACETLCRCASRNTHCNEPSLSVVFKCKLADSWMAKEVQERIDKYHREIKSRPSKPYVVFPQAECVSTPAKH